jgi:hypothetical protein
MHNVTVILLFDSDGACARGIMVLFVFVWMCLYVPALFSLSSIVKVPTNYKWYYLLGFQLVDFTKMAWYDQYLLISMIHGKFCRLSLYIPVDRSCILDHIPEEWKRTSLLTHLKKPVYTKVPVLSEKGSCKIFIAGAPNTSHIVTVVTSCGLLPIYFYRQRARAPILDIEARQFNELFPDFQGFILRRFNLHSIDSMLLLQVKDIVYGS